jgi:CheY-like chemotaxis protein
MKKILFIEDDPILGPVYQAQLKRAGFEVVWATDGEAGLNALQISQPDLIVLDIQLPRVSGLELLQIIRSSPGVDHLPVIVFTNSFQEDVLAKVRKTGVERILSKSQVIPREVVAIIREFLVGAEPAQAVGSTGSEAPENKAFTAALQRQLGDLLASCRRMVTEVNRDSVPETRVAKIRLLRNIVRQLIHVAAAANLKAQAYFCEALDALLVELCDQPARLTVSSLRTVTQSVDFLFENFDPTRQFTLPANLAFRILIVDDDPISRRAVQVALSRIKLQAMECGSAPEALEHCSRGRFDVIFLDVNMPEVNGYDLCSRLRKLELNQATPVIFVTSQTDLLARAQSNLSGGNDFIGKPFHFMELAVKTLLHVLRSKLK